VLTDAKVEKIHYSSIEGSEEQEFVSLSYRSLRIESPHGAAAGDDWITEA
jgi:type VI protein secretion system component Hcp